MSRPRHCKFAREAMRYAERMGFRKVWIDHGRRHPIIRAEVNGTAIRVVIPGTPSDQRSLRNTYADLRRAARGVQP